MSSINIDQISSVSSIDTFAPVAVYRLKYYEPESLFDNVLYALIRPPRFVYNEKLLIPSRRYQQQFDYEVHNIPFPLSIYWAQNPKYIILYLHGNSSSRFEGYLHLKELPEGACLACFDFKGCGLRKDGKFITLGKQQSIEVDIAVQYLKTYGYPIVGWGRSMGAVSLLMSSKCQIMIADSPFCSLYDLCKETSLNFIPTGLCCLVHCLFPCLFCCVRSGVEKKSGMDPNDLETIKAVEKQCPSKSILLMAGKQDSMIHYSHAQRLHNAFRGQQKRLILFQGTHNSSRPQQVMDECFSFIDSCVEKRQQNKFKILKPLQYENTCKVFKLDKQSSKQSLINNPTIQMSQHREFESSKETLLAHMKSPIQLIPMKIHPTKSSPKKLSRIEGNIQINEEADIRINHQQNVKNEQKQKFQKDAFNPNKQTFHSISIKNQIQNTVKRPIQLKSIKPIRQINEEKQRQYANIQIKTRKQQKSHQYPALLNDKINSQDGSIKISDMTLNQKQSQKQTQKINNLKVDVQEKFSLNNKSQIIKESEPQVRAISRPSSLYYEDVKLIQEDQESSLNDYRLQIQSSNNKLKSEEKQKIEKISPFIEGLVLITNRQQLESIDM